MDFRLDDNEKMVSDMFDRFAKEQLREAGAEADRAAACPDDIINKGIELGLFLDAIPETAGGYLEGDQYSHTQRALRLIALGGACPSIATVYEANTEFALVAQRLGEAGHAVLNELSEPDKARACLVLSRADAPLTFSGGGVQGRAGGVPNATTAGVFLVVSTEDASEPFVAIVRGATVEAQSSMGLRAAGIGAVTFEGAEVVCSATGSDAVELVGLARNAHRIMAGALAVGAAQASMDYSEEYAAERFQFGQAIGKFESLARLIHENRGRLAAAKFLVFAAAQALESNQADTTQLCRQAAVVSGEAAVRTAIDAVQIYGGYGFVNEYPVEKIMRDVRAFTTMAGDSLREEVLKTALAS